MPKFVTGALDENLDDHSISDSFELFKAAQWTILKISIIEIDLFIRGNVSSMSIFIFFVIFVIFKWEPMYVITARLLQ